MTHYRSNVRDIEFNLFEVLDRESILGQEPYADLDRETVSAILAEADHLARTKLADTFAIGEHEPPVFDPQDPHGDAAGGVQGLVQGADGLGRLGAGAAGRAGRAGDPALGAVGGQRAQLRRQSGGLPLQRGPEVRLGAVGVRHRAGQEDRPAHDRPRLERDDDADRAGCRLRRRRRADQGDAAARRDLAPRGRQALHHRRRARPEREHRAPGAGPAGGRRGSRRSGHQGPQPVHRAEASLRPGDRRADRRTQRGVRHQPRAQDGDQGFRHLRDDLRRTAPRRSVGCSARCTTASPRCSR